MASGREEPSLHVVILAAGQGTRMRSARNKMLHRVAGSPMVCHVARAAAALRPSSMVAVVGHQASEVSAALLADPWLPPGAVTFVRQERQLGTGHALLQVEPMLRARVRRGTTLLVLNGDVPLVRPSTLRALLRRHRRAGAAASLLATTLSDPSGYGRVARGARGEFLRIVEDSDASAPEKRITEINAGLYCADPGVFLAALHRTGRENAQGEIYLPDAFTLLLRRGRTVCVYQHPEAEEVLGVNDQGELAAAGKILYRRKAGELMESGVTLLDPDTTFIEPGVSVGADTVVHPLARLEGRTRVGSGCTIGALSHVVDSTLGDRVVVRDSCVIAASRVEAGAVVGPFAHLRPGTVLERDAHVGNFVEIKKSRLGRGSKANHLTYLGDAEIGERCNIGAGTITCNYDGRSKNATIVEDDVFIGSDTQLVAPVRVRRGAYVGAGSTITEEVPEHALALSRVRQRNLPGWSKRRRAELEQGRAEEPAGAGAGGPAGGRAGARQGSKVSPRPRARAARLRRKA